MTFSELVQAVKDITGRPDREAAIKLAVSEATLLVHLTDTYSRDLVETVLVFGSEAYLQQFTLSSTVPNFRAVKYVRKIDTSTNAAGDFLRLRSLDTIFNEFGAIESDIFYRAGDNLNINSSTLLKKVIFGYYKYPTTSESLYNSWIALEQPYAIVTKAAAEIFRITGKAEEANIQHSKFEQFYRPALRQFVVDYGE